MAEETNEFAREAIECKQTASGRIRDRNIVDTLRDDHASGSRKNWKALQNKLCLKRTGKAWISSVPIPTSDIPIQSATKRVMTRRGSWRYPNEDAGGSDYEATTQLGRMRERQRSIRLIPLEIDPEDEDDNNSPDCEQKQAAGEGHHMSLLTLLSTDGSSYAGDEEEQDEEHHQERVEEETGDGHICCGCTAKHNGAASSPCGHTFCKHCTKELDLSRGNCPACDDFILEMLDIF